MYDYIRQLGKELKEDELIEVLGTVSLLNEQPFCKQWIPLISSVGVQGMLSLCENLGGQDIQIPNIYQVLMVYAALMTLELNKRMPYEEAKQFVVGRLCLDGFDELVNQIRTTQTRIIESADSIND